MINLSPGGTARPITLEGTLKSAYQHGVTVSVRQATSTEGQSRDLSRRLRQYCIAVSAMATTPTGPPIRAQARIWTSWRRG